VSERPVIDHDCPTCDARAGALCGKPSPLDVCVCGLTCEEHEQGTPVGHACRRFLVPKPRSPVALSHSDRHRGRADRRWRRMVRCYDCETRVPILKGKWGWRQRRLDRGPRTKRRAICAACIAAEETEE